MEQTLPRQRLRRDVLGEALICAGLPHFRIRLSRSVLWLTSWSTVSASSPYEAVTALAKRSFAAVFVELSPVFVGQLASILAWDSGTTRARPFVIGVAGAEPCDVPSGWLDARLGVDYGPRAFSDLFAGHEEDTLASFGAPRELRAPFAGFSRGGP